MALKPCKECGQEVSTSAATCPHCGVKDPARARHFGCSGCLGVLGILLVIGWIGNLFDGSSDSTSSAPTRDRDLQAGVSFTGTQFVIMNNEGSDWSNCRLDVNGDYRVEARSIGAGSSVSVGAAQLANRDGVRFNPFTMKPQNFSVRCDVAGGGKGFYYATWR